MKIKSTPLDSVPAALATSRGGGLWLYYFKAPTNPRLEHRDRAGTRQWEFELQGHEQGDVPIPPLRIDEDGSAWTVDGSSLVKVDLQGNVVLKIRVDLQDNERIGTFVLLGEGLVVASYRPASGSDGSPRVLRLDTRGGVVWDTTLAAGDKLMSASMNPRGSYRPAHWEPLLVTGDLVVPGYTNHSGIGLRHGLSLETGKLHWTTPPGPIDRIAIAGRERVLIGFQGYGVFETQLYEQAGLVQRWATAGLYVVDETGDIRVIELDNSAPSGRLIRLHSNGCLERGGVLEGYHTSNPVLARDGRIAFCREGRLFIADGELNLSCLGDVEGHVHKTILAADGTLVFSATNSTEEGYSSALCFVETDLGSMECGYWPCEGGNPLRNPVFV